MKKQVNTYKYQKLRGLKRKLHLIDLRNGCCEKCGYNKNLSGLDFHHKDPTQKESQLDMRSLSNSTMEWILKEFEKCEILCANCHREEHSPDLEIEFVREKVKNIEESVIKIVVGKPKCLDCGIELWYGSKRCGKCNNIFRRKVKRPDLEILKKEVEEYGILWCTKKYGVVRITIQRWIERKIQ